MPRHTRTKALAGLAPLPSASGAVGVDSEGHIYVADTSFNNFQVFDQEGHLLLFVGSGGREAGEFLLPAGLYVDSQDRIYVADQGNSRVQVFQYLKAEPK